MGDRLNSRTTIRATGAVWIVVGLALMASDSALAIPFVGLGILFWSRASATARHGPITTPH